jgi:hypothetical protein
MPVSFSSESLVPATPVTRTNRPFPELVEEGSTATLSFTIQTAAGGAVANTDIDSMTLTLVDEETGNYINTRQDQDVLGGAKTGANNHTVSATSDVVFSMLALDSIVVDPTKTKNLEFHRAIYTITTTIAATTEIAIREFRFAVRPTFQALAST